MSIDIVDEHWQDSR